MADRHTTEKLLEGERLSGKVTLFAKVTILPGDELPYLFPVFIFTIQMKNPI